MLPIETMYVASRQKAGGSIYDRKFNFELPYTLKQTCAFHICEGKTDVNANDKIYRVPL